MSVCTLRRIRPLLPRVLLGLYLCSAPAWAHQIPVMQIEAEFMINQHYTLRINLDPRVFLSDQPSSLPPVPASWYKDQTPEQIKATEKTAMAYLRKNVKLQFGVAEAALPECSFVALDGANNKPISDETQEVHLLATAEGTAPPTGRNFSINLGRETGVSLILLNTMEGQNERKPRVIFPGEGSEPFPLKGMRAPLDPNALPEAVSAPKSEMRLWLWRGGITVALFVIYNLFLKKRRVPKLQKKKHSEK